MIKHIILSETDKNEATNIFTRWLEDKPVTLILVPGSGEDFKKALDKADEMVNSGSPNYASVRAIHAPKPEFILDKLKQLKVNPDIEPVNWSIIEQYVIITISNKYYNIGKVITKKEFSDNPVSIINLAVLITQAVDKKL